MNYDLCLFIDIVESIQGVTFLRDESTDGISAKLYQGVNGRLVIIDITDDEASDDTYKGHLRNLGCEYLIDSMFPKVPEEVAPPSDIHLILENLKLDKD